MKEKIANLVKLSQAIGSRLDYVQGGGGNISVKILDDLMAIKASGFELKNLDEKSGFAFVDHQEINHEIANFCRNQNGSDEEFSSAVKSATKQISPYPNLRPSMETGFHSLLPFKYVIHSHSVYATVLACSVEGKKITQEILPNSLWVDYHNPGWQLTAALANSLKNNSKPSVIILQNHGLIVAADDCDGALDLHCKVNEKIKKYLHLAEFEMGKPSIYGHEFIKHNVLFPDQIVFGLSPEFHQSLIAKQIFSCYSYILNAIEKLGFTPSFISQSNVDFVASMESEKFRKNLAKSNSKN
jgi:rhamnose utilization protein RhaD (predicted bifunctional aldolase and dehydrogenase)